MNKLKVMIQINAGDPEGLAKANIYFRTGRDPWEYYLESSFTPGDEPVTLASDLSDGETVG